MAFPYQRVERFSLRQITNVLTGVRVKLYGDDRNARDLIHIEGHSNADMISFTTDSTSCLSGSSMFTNPSSKCGMLNAASGAATSAMLSSRSLPFSGI